ncbi:Serine/threonine-protein kinase stk11 [Boothiomyces macroporosus]|uniref:Serine/threonine-protein kinase stk11 n=1 Tax=Boothiomyces macroporosus TaxID=261099 RepID=A0AAD5UN86_9FUNG|nr:Serine/threonine-protein kinase stk11 [Boothiomyces macroporosus]
MMANRTSLLQLADNAVDRNNSNSKPSINNLNKSGESFGRPVSLISLKKLNQIRESTPNLVVDEIPQPAMNSEYLDYLMLQQRHSSCNFIQKIDSNEIVWETKQTQIKMLGPHLVGGKIGKGAFGKVKEGICADSLQRIAIKILAKKRVKKMVDTVIREIKLLRRLKHKNIVTLVDVFAKVEDNEGKAGIFPWFLTIEEEPIVWIFEDGTEEEKDVKILKWYIIMEFCAYRDIKPGNLLITTDGVIKLTDFGIAECYNFYDDKPMYSQTFAGTHQFVPPEVLKDESETGFDGTKVDIWAAGVVLYYMVAGKLPFEFEDEENIIDLHERIIKGVYQMPKDIPADCQDLIDKILQKEPEQRLTIEKIQVHPWTLSYVQPTLKSGESNIKIYQDTSNSVSTNKDNDIPCDTTMTPFLSQLYQEELERDLEDSGIISLWSSSEDDISGSKKKKMINWLKNAMKKE